MKSKFSKMIVLALLFAVIGYGAGVVFVVYAQNGGIFDMSALKDKIALAVMGVGFLIGFIIPLVKKPKKKESNNTGKTASGDKFDLHYDTHFMTDNELYGNKFLINSSWKDLPGVKNTGLVVRSQMKNGKFEITMKDEVHNLVIGTTGSGKTTMIIDPTIRILAHSGEKPSIVVTDPKGELYEKHAEILRQEGYQVVVYDLDNPFLSSRWNPMERAFKLYHRALHIASEAKKYSNCTPESVNKKKIPGYEYGDVWYEFNGMAFPTEDMLKQELSSTKQQLINEAMFDLRGIAAAVCPVDERSNDRSWDDGAQNFLFGIMLAMLEDSNDERLGDKKLRIDQFNFYNLYKIAMKKDDNPDDPFITLKKYCGARLKTSEVSPLTTPVINTAPNTTRSYMSVLSSKITGLMQDMGICYATSGTDIDFAKFIEKPTAFFLKAPDHKKERHPLAIVCITQLYRSLVDIANKYPGLKLPRHVYFLMDEFGNLPVIPDFATMVTVSRSRNIFFEIIIQSYTQLDTKYGKEISDTLKGNFNAQIFLGTEDQNTKDAFSKSLGEVQLTHEEKSETENKGKDSSGKSTSKSIQRTTRPLMSADELGQIPFGTGIVRLFRLPPLKTEFAHFPKTNIFEKKSAPPIVGISKRLDEETVFFDIDERNLKIYGRPTNRWGSF